MDLFGHPSKTQHFYNMIFCEELNKVTVGRNQKKTRKILNKFRKFKILYHWYKLKNLLQRKILSVRKFKNLLFSYVGCCSNLVLIQTNK